MDVEKFRQAVVTKVYHIPAVRKVPLHQHPKHDEVFYCVAGSGFGVVENSQVELTPGKAFIVPAKTLHSLRTDGDLYVTSFLIPLADDPAFCRVFLHKKTRQEEGVWSGSDGLAEGYEF